MKPSSEQLYLDNPYLVGQTIPSNWALWCEYLEPRGLLTPNTTPCTCRFCEMNEREIDEYRAAIRRIYGKGDE